jgi:hypothetical protein
MADVMVDLAAFRPAGTEPAEHVLADATSSGETVTSEAKLAQRVILELLTEKQSMPFLSRRGTSLLSRLRSGQIRTEHDLFVAYAVAALDVSRNLRSEDASTDDPSSRYAGSRLRGLRLDTGSGLAELTIEITSKAGIKNVIYLPINVRL